MKIQKNIDISKLTTFKIGPVAREYAEVNSEDELKELINYANLSNIPFLILGGGSNVLFKNKIFEGLVIKNNIKGIRIVNESYVLVKSAERLVDLIDFLARNNLSGMEEMYGIPGTLGGAVRGNAGAFGVEIKDILKSVRAINTNTLKEFVFSNKECSFGFRESFFKFHPEWIVLEAEIILKSGIGKDIKSKCNKILSERNKRHLQDVMAAGSFFKNPVATKEVIEIFEKEKNTTSRGGRVPAGWIIEKVGLKNASVGGAQISPQHANYLINKDGSATADDILALKNMIQKRVFVEFGIDMETEVHIIE